MFIGTVIIVILIIASQLVQRSPDKLESIVLTRALTMFITAWSNNIKLNISRNSIKNTECPEKSEFEVAF